MTTMTPTTDRFKAATRGAHITHVKHGPGGRGQPSLIICVTYDKTGELDTAIVDVAQRDFSVVAEALAGWLDVKTLAWNTEYAFDTDEQPMCTAVTRNNRLFIDDIQIDFVRRAGAIDKLMQEHDVAQSAWNTAETRSKNRSFPTTLLAKASMIDTYAKKEPDMPTKVDEYVPPSQATTPLDEAFPRTPDGKPVEDTLANPHPLADPDFHRELGKLRKKYRQTATMDTKQWDDYRHGKFGVASFLELNLTPEAVLGVMATELEKDFAASAPASNQKADNSHDAKSTTDEPKVVPPVQPEPIAPTPTPTLAKTDEPAIEGEVIDEPIKPVTPPATIAVVPNTGIAGLPMMEQWNVMRQQADVFIKSGFLPQSIKTPEQAITIMMMGSALQIDPIVALNNINVIQGKPTVSPQLMLALVRRSGQLESFKVTDDGTSCTVEIKRRNEPLHIERFSQQDAVAMGLAGKDNWRKQPAVMRKWRAIAAACRVVFPDVTWGVASYTTEELDPDTEVAA